MRCCNTTISTICLSKCGGILWIVSIVIGIWCPFLVAPQNLYQFISWFIDLEVKISIMRTCDASVVVGIGRRRSRLSRLSNAPLHVEYDENSMSNSSLNYNISPIRFTYVVIPHILHLGAHHTALVRRYLAFYSTQLVKQHRTRLTLIVRTSFGVTCLKEARYQYNGYVQC